MKFVMSSIAFGLMFKANPAMAATAYLGNLEFASF